MNILIKPSQTGGSITPPSSKSLLHRALICAGLASGKSTISSLSCSRDIEATISCLNALGIKIQTVQKEEDGKKFTFIVEGSDVALRNFPVVMDAYESGSTLRFLIPIAASSASSVTFTGQPSLMIRPMKIYDELFKEQGLLFNQNRQTIEIKGPLKATHYTIDGNVSSQFISGMLMAAPLFDQGKKETALSITPPYQSRSYTNLTVSMMKEFGVTVQEPDELSYIVPADQSYQPKDLQVESDYSQMAFFGVLGAIQNSITCMNMNPDSAQGDKVILKFLKQAGAKLTWNDQSVCIESAKSQNLTLKPCVMDLADCPDLGPILCVLAAYTPGTTRLIHASRLRYKECDRIAAMEEELRKWGVNINSDEDSITIQGKETYSCDHLVEVDSHNDHRIVMAMAIFGACAGSDSLIHNAQAIKKSYPLFFEDFKKVKGDASVWN
ncbi:3-phosphoshikimate 1-carboxyvinyltransferase [Ileibacterium valens]|uniref:3-phosphoshikimate 1-carboxyvinyltransferase n=1 Tax=Ileibacterium valens TaxID=1862668 RepID=UPI002572E6EA|nr:3-phosphoshikimate 1-carboxyvinyltransferase [Ileibacterium valens]